ncbi:MAG: hypothetical protein ACFFE4_22385 [Candidatus Thorarchaeota archaeon]
MKTGKIIVLVGAIITLVSTFFLSFGQTNGLGGRSYISGIGLMFNLPEIFGNPAYWISTFPGYTSEDTILIYLYGILFIVFALSGVIQLVGLKNKYVAIIGSGLTIAFAIMVMLYLTAPADVWKRFGALMWSDPIIDGNLMPIWPLEIPLIATSVWGYQNISLGAITIFVGGGLGLVGGILGIKDI